MKRTTGRSGTTSFPSDPMVILAPSEGGTSFWKVGMGGSGKGRCCRKGQRKCEGTAGESRSRGLRGGPGHRRRSPSFAAYGIQGGASLEPGDLLGREGVLGEERGLPSIRL